MRAFILALVGPLLSVMLWIGVHASQDAALRFEVASVKPNVGSDLCDDARASGQTAWTWSHATTGLRRATVFKQRRW